MVVSGVHALNRRISCSFVDDNKQHTTGAAAAPRLHKYTEYETETHLQ